MVLCRSSGFIVAVGIISGVRELFVGSFIQKLT